MYFNVAKQYIDIPNKCDTCIKRGTDMTTKFRIMECTLRDGSYAVNFQFTKDDTRAIVKTLEELGFELIEVGHGIGLGASENTESVAAETDEAYLKVTAETIKKASWGMFCIPGIAELHHLDLAHDYGMPFVRIGTNIEEYKKSKPYIERAKKYGMFVCSNFMKSYIVTPKKFAEYAVEIENYGSDLVYIVDSAGGMLPEEVEQYYIAIHEKTKTLKLGFHGHNNLGLGVANALKAVDLGFDIVDTSLQGFGRSAGNTSTEQFLCTLMRKGIDINIDPIAVMDAGEKFIQPLIDTRGLSSIDMVSGLSLFHSSYMPIIKEYAHKYRIDPRKLIIAVCETDKTNAPPELVEESAKKLREMDTHGSWKWLYNHYYGREQEK